MARHDLLGFMSRVDATSNKAPMESAFAQPIALDCLEAPVCPGFPGV